LKDFPHADRPGARHDGHAEHALDFIHEVHRRAHLAIHLVDERDDRRGLRAAHLQQAECLRLDAVRGVDHHQRGVHRRQHAIGVLGEIAVARRVEQIEHAVAVLHLHHRARHRDAALLLDLHPVGSGVARSLARLDAARDVDRAGVQQELFRERGLARVRMRDDGERSSPRDFPVYAHCRLPLPVDLEGRA
jgi:hypothetical protein